MTAIEQTFTYSNTSSIPISESHMFTLYSKNAQCSLGTDAPTFSAGFKVDLTAKANATLDYGLALAGTIVPPEITAFSLVTGLDAKLDGILAFDISATVGTPFIEYNVQLTDTIHRRPPSLLASFLSSLLASLAWTSQG